MKKVYELVYRAEDDLNELSWLLWKEQQGEYIGVDSVDYALVTLERVRELLASAITRAQLVRAERQSAPLPLFGDTDTGIV